MSWFEALILGLIQGLTEYLPVSSSGHLAIGQALFGMNDGADNLMFTVAVHVATVLSTIVILWSEIDWILKGLFKFEMNAETKYVLNIIVSMIPVGIVGVFFKDYVEEVFGSGLLIVGCCLLITSALLIFSYYAKPRQKEHISMEGRLHHRSGTGRCRTAWRVTLRLHHCYRSAVGQQEGVAGTVLIPDGHPPHSG